MESPGARTLRDLLACPQCFGDLVHSDGRISCSVCAATYRVDEGIPIFASEIASQHDELDHIAATDHPPHSVQAGHKESQAAWFDREQHAEFEIERPTRGPALYRFLLMEKFRRAIGPMGGRLDGRTALAVCGGSGMDAEMLSLAGAAVISSDISLGAAKRARERARRHGVPILSIVADVEHLPFRDRAIDLVFVHDGLHHLEEPQVGLQEMARVAARWVSITEPARAAITRVAVSLGLAKSREESGNRVARLEPDVVCERLRAAGFSVLRSQRYAMYYRHSPGAVFELLSRPWMFGIVTTAWKLANMAIGHMGNKLAIVAERRQG
jgi:SAM-dependent methyltransferase/uncharacterized protein YbaR (Trm112 family)